MWSDARLFIYAILETQFHNLHVETRTMKPQLSTVPSIESLVMYIQFLGADWRELQRRQGSVI